MNLEQYDDKGIIHICQFCGEKLKQHWSKNNHISECKVIKELTQTVFK